MKKNGLILLIGLTATLGVGPLPAAPSKTPKKAKGAKIEAPAPKAPKDSPAKSELPKRDYSADSLFMEATALFLTEKPQQALNAYLQLLEKQPDNATAAYQVAQLLTLNKQFSMAQIYAEKACRLSPQNEWYQQLLAQLYKTARQFNKAAEIYQYLQELYPENLDFAYEEANMHVLAGSLQGAIGVYDKLESRFGLTDAWSMQKYKLYMGLGNDKAARSEIERISKEMPYAVKYPQMLAQMCLKNKEYKAAYAYLKRVMELEPDDPYNQISLADYYRNTGDFRQAFAALEKAVNNPNLDFQTKVSVLQTYYDAPDNLKPQGDLMKEAAILFKALNKVHPSEPQGFFAHAKFLLFNENYAGAVALLEHAIELDSHNYSVWKLMFYACHISADTTRLAAYAASALKRFPEQCEPAMYLGITYSLQRELDKAIEYALLSQSRNFIRDAYVSKVNLQVLGDAYFETGQHEKSLNVYEELFRLDPQDAYVRNNYAYYLALAGRELAKAEQLAARICKEQPQNATFLDTYGWVLYRLGQWDKAVTYIKAALNNGADKDATVWEHYGDVLYKKGNTDQARQAWEKALHLTEDKAKEQSLNEKMEDPKKWIE